MTKTIPMLCLLGSIGGSAMHAAVQHEHRATVLLRSGERVSGVLEDVERGTVYVRVSRDDQRQLPVANVALIDFAGGATGLPDTETRVAAGADHLALLRGGESWQGRFVDIRGGETDAPAGEPHALVFRTTDGRERSIPLDSVSRVYLGNFPVSTTTVDQGGAQGSGVTTGEPAPAGAVRVPANNQWTPTPYMVRKGDLVSFSASGKIQLSDNSSDVAQPAGALSQRKAPAAPLPQFFAGALIARVGTGTLFAIGDNALPIAMPAAGQLFLGINDEEVRDNRGEFIVQVVPARRR